jgi:hypothetical protein
MIGGTMANHNTPSQPKLWFYAIVFLLLFTIMAHFTRRMYRDWNPGSFSANRGAERIKARKDIETKTATELSTAGWVDQGKGIVRLPINQAMQITIEQWGANPSAARSNLIERAQKAAAPAPKVPEKPSQFE